MDYRLRLRVPFASAQDASIALNTLVVDKEPKPDICRRTMDVQDNTLLVTFEATELRTLRVASAWFMDMLQLTCETIDAFSLPA
ncbi:hypothetical protein PTSG_01189 [Salpingoeca rosetta]|uniref:Transcription factor Pcc1 n=1 Tax=Salpingoeca rosetta (strain ATCC 50818 / BSB-021) TaxID=946362 RepID=F2U126_SALR5|nr:uncharacterized protein PTSG_01189 [Salpingoeca rosetta]EGD80600.1 hypothetical protein PTSG_01189 [Salpingoeca rosetta]|eukprot:XP_004997161.1 hypothetical protein PTSG_01189 [Salpingoeca rosetta]